MKVNDTKTLAKRASAVQLSAGWGAGRSSDSYAIEIKKPTPEWAFQRWPTF
jgi:hypothetical protein